MKNLIAVILASGLAGWSVHAQGTVQFANLNVAAGVNAPVYHADGIRRVSGPAWLTELMAGPNSTSLAQIANTTFLTGGGAGYFDGGSQAIATVPGGGTAWIQLDIWDSTLGGTTTGATLAQAQASGLYDVWVQTGVFSEITGDPNAIPATPPAPLTGLGTSSIFVPEPSALSLAGLGLAGLLLFRRRK